RHDQGDAAGREGLARLGLAGRGGQGGGQGQRGGGGLRRGFHVCLLCCVLVCGGKVSDTLRVSDTWQTWRACPARAGAWPRGAQAAGGNSTMASPTATVSPRWLVTCTSSVAHWLFSVLRVAVMVARGVMVSPGLTGIFQRVSRRRCTPPCG